MKQIIAAILIGTLLFPSCKKENKMGIDQTLIGQWNWKSYQVGSPTNTSTPQNSGIHEFLIFNSDLTWSKTQNGTIIRSGNYRTSVTKTNTGKSVNTLRFNNSKNGMDTTGYYSIQSDTTLTFSHDLVGTTGSSSSIYVKKIIF